MKRYRFHQEARLEVQAAATWYRERSAEAARGFTSTMTEAVQSIRQHPQAWAAWHHAGVRRRVLRRFPYSIFYLFEEDDAVVIVAVAHHKQRPGYWLPRLER